MLLLQQITPLFTTASPHFCSTAPILSKNLTVSGKGHHQQCRRVTLSVALAQHDDVVLDVTSRASPGGGSRIRQRCTTRPEPPAPGRRHGTARRHVQRHVVPPAATCPASRSPERHRRPRALLAGPGPRLGLVVWATRHACGGRCGLHYLHMRGDSGLRALQAWMRATPQAQAVRRSLSPPPGSSSQAAFTSSSINQLRPANCNAD